jgi:glucosamine-phosphate N-acetyltransferase
MEIYKKIIYCDFVDLYLNNQLNLSKNNLKNQYLELLNELSIVDNISDELFEYNLIKINSMGKIIIGYINNSINSINSIELVGSGTIIIEPKIIRSCMNVGHIEDIVVKSNFRGMKISQNILNKLKNHALNNNCYKVILDCDINVISVYKSNGFESNGIQMVKYF